mmetsp:Transcript_13643/g.35304  ORF Transcript_13643/g.35304 Transcript_13643/m.35304 type:complete len:292 (-) Transcript_13643:369-1244(-)
MALPSRQLLPFARRCGAAPAQLLRAAEAAALTTTGGPITAATATTTSASAPLCRQWLGAPCGWAPFASSAAHPASEGDEAPGEGADADDGPACWKCGAAHCAGRRGRADPLKCPACRTVLPPPPDVEQCMFRLLGENPSFDIDLQRLEAQYKELQREFHPDKFATASPTEQEYSARYASLINEGYAMLKRPLQRARLLLKTLGASSEAEEEGTIDVDPQLLMETMEAREEVEAATGAAELGALRARNDELQAECGAALSAAFAGGNLAEARRLVQRLTYLTRIGEEILRKL